MPFNDNTLPVWSVPLYAVLLPIEISFFIYLRRRDVYDLLHAILGLYLQWCNARIATMKKNDLCDPEHNNTTNVAGSSKKANNARGQADIGYFSVTKDDNVDNTSLQQKLHEVVKQREELQQIEIELWAQYLVRSEIVDMQTSFDAQMKEHASTKAKLQEQLREREQTIRESEKKIEEKKMEMHVLRLDSKAERKRELRNSKSSAY